MKRNSPIQPIPAVIRIMFITLLMTGFACERNERVEIPAFDCYDCFQNRPEWVDLNVTVTINSENPWVPLTVYVGDVEDGNVDWVDTAVSTRFRLDVKPDRYYSVKAEYKEGAKIIYAVDGDDVKLKKNTSDCDEPCYYQKGGYVDVRLK